MSTGIMMSTGDCDPRSKVCTYYGAADDPVRGFRDKMSKSIVRFIDDDKYVFEMYELPPNGTEIKIMELEYTRRK